VIEKSWRPQTGTANDTNKPTKTGALFDDMQEEDLGPMQGPARPPPKVAAAVAAAAAAEQEQEATLGDMQGPARPPPRGGEGAGGGGVAVDPYTHAYPQPPPMAPVWTGQVRGVAVTRECVALRCVWWEWERVYDVRRPT
jgi:hypothetical protein